MPNLFNYGAQSMRAQWHLLVSMSALLLLQFVFCRPAKAQMRDIERAEPSRQTPRQAPKPSPEAQHLVIVRALQTELHLNEYGVIRALRYLRQGYPVSEVRNLFAPTVRKS